MVLSAKVKIHVQAELNIDLLDHVSLLDRCRMIRSGRWDVDGLVRSVSPRSLLDQFVKDFAQAVKPVSSFFCAKHCDAEGCWQKETSHKQSYIVVVPAGRTEEVIIDASIVDPPQRGVLYPENGAHVQDIVILSSSSTIHQIELDHKDGNLQADSMLRGFQIKVEFDPFDNNNLALPIKCVSSLNTCYASTICEMNVGEVGHSSDSSASANGMGSIIKCSQACGLVSPQMSACFPSKNFAERDVNGFFRSSLETSHKEDTVDAKFQNLLLASFPKRLNEESEIGSVPIASPKVDLGYVPAASLKCQSVHEENISICAPCLPFLRNNHESMSPNDTDLHKNHERSCNAYCPAIVDVKISVLGHKRVLCDTENCTSDRPLSLSHATVAVKSEPVEHCHNDPKLEKTKIFGASTSGSQEKVMESQPPFSRQRDPVNGAINETSAEAIPNHPGLHLVTSISPSHLVKVKPEPLEMVFSSARDSVDMLSDYNTTGTHVKMESNNEYSDALDHMTLKERLKMLVASEVFFSGTNSSECSKHFERRSQNSLPAPSETFWVKSSGHRRKRKKTATDSVETALEEDAPGLLQVLMEQGINLNDIKLYGGMDGDEMLDISSMEDSFEDLDNVVSKLFIGPSSSLLNLASLRGTGVSKAVYCLSCLVSLIEQTQYLQLRNCPVQWGWCRDLQSFIFVFEKHNRIVLERPEYGYATYFFELVHSLPVDWQIMRLVTAMKATQCRRATIVENKSLLVGQDLSESEARVLEEYGWRRNSGLGSLLNFCDRVVHDKWNEMNNSEWKAKIGELLMTGFDGGRLVTDNVPRKVVEYMGDDTNECTSLKLECDDMLS